MPYYGVLLSSGVVLETSDEKVFVDWLDKHGSEVESTCEKSLEAAVQAGLIRRNDPDFFGVCVTRQDFS